MVRDRRAIKSGVRARVTKRQWKDRKSANVWVRVLGKLIMRGKVNHGGKGQEKDSEQHLSCPNRILCARANNHEEEVNVSASDQGHVWRESALEWCAVEGEFAAVVEREAEHT